MPVLDSGMLREWVDTARAAVRDNHKVSLNGHRLWELSGSVTWSGLCGAQMETSGVNGRNRRRHFYYRCWRRNRVGDDACPRLSNYVARRIEPTCGSSFLAYSKTPRACRRARGDDRGGAQEAYEVTRRARPERGFRSSRSGAQEKQLSKHGGPEGLFTFGELRAKLTLLERSRNAA